MSAYSKKANIRIKVTFEWDREERWAWPERDRIRVVPPPSRAEPAHAADSGLNELKVLMSQRDRPTRRRILVAATEQA